jgi:hypothetical protein
MPRLFTLVLVALAAALSQERPTIRTPQGLNLELYPATLASRPDLPSPFTAEDGTEVVLALSTDGQFALVPVTLRDRPLQLPWKVLSGDQRKVDADDFPTLARTGLHARQELDRLKTITGKPVSAITESARPMRLSAAGFLAHDEDIVSVLQGDNALVARIGLTHPKLARPLFHVWNLVLREIELGRFGRSWSGFQHILYRSRKVSLTGWGTKSFQESIFNDEIRGTCDLQISRGLDTQEKAFLEMQYSTLGPDRLDELMQKLSSIRIGEMHPYYITRYGFYEGHTLWRADPLAITFIFGLRSLEEVEKAFPGRLYRALTDHHTKGADIR